MNKEQAALWKKVENHSLDVAGASFPFTAKLARENGWPVRYAHRVAAEYKRFAFLSAIAGHPVSPSDAVDQAWHLHLMYTEDYWKVFCPEVLGRALHHGPSKGGREEAVKFEDWYANTLESYRKFFGHEPPLDIWPARQLHGHYVRVDKHQNWVVKKPRIRLRWRHLALAGLGPVAVGCSQSGSWNPINFYGPDFLRFYLGLQVVAWGIGGYLRWALRMPIEGDEVPKLDTYQVAYLSGGPVLAMNTAITGLVAEDIVQVNGSKATIQTISQSVPTDDFQAFIANKARSLYGIKISSLRNHAFTKLKLIRTQLESKGLWVPPQKRALAVWVPFLVAISPMALGITKAYVGAGRERPILFLILSMTLYAAISAVLFCRRPGRSRYGDRVLKALRQGNRDPYPTMVLAAETVMAGVALHGMGSLDQTPYRKLRRDLQPPTGTSTCGGGCHSSGGSCGGGGGCGGGGCGGCGG